MPSANRINGPRVSEVIFDKFDAKPSRVDRDGHNGWSRRSEAAWERVFGPPRPVLWFTEEEERHHLERQRHEVNRQFTPRVKEAGHDDPRS